MRTDESFSKLIQELQQQHNFSDESIKFLMDKGFEQQEFQQLFDVMNLRDQTFIERRKEKSWIEKTLDRGDSEEITTGRYNRHVVAFKDISSEQVLVKGRMKFGIEYDIGLADLIGGNPKYSELIERPFNEEEKVKLRSIYENFRTKDFLAAKIIERKTKHDIVAVNTWIAIRAQQSGLDDRLLRRITHLARTSSDANTNVTGELYMRAIGRWASSLVSLLDVLGLYAEDYAEVTCVAETHGQDAQLTTLGYIYGNLAEQIKKHAKPFLEKNMLKLDGKIAGAIGTDVDMKTAFPDINPTSMYQNIVENVFGLRYVELGNDQDCSNAALSLALDTMVNVGMVIKKAATDTWIYASREILAKKTTKGESGSSAMPQKANPFLAEGCEALVSIFSNMINPIKEMIVAYREQGDLRRSITKREGFHPVMLSIISIERLISEMKKYKPNIVALEAEIYHSGPKIITSTISNILRAKGIHDAYDRIKEIVMKPDFSPGKILDYLNNLLIKEKIEIDTADDIEGMLYSVMDTEGYMKKLRESTDPDEQEELIDKLAEVNRNETRRELLGNAIEYTHRMVKRTEKTKELLLRYVN